jgi:hypothetical protein
MQTELEQQIANLDPMRSGSMVMMSSDELDAAWRKVQTTSKPRSDHRRTMPILIGAVLVLIAASIAVLVPQLTRSTPAAADQLRRIATRASTAARLTDDTQVLTRTMQVGVESSAGDTSMTGIVTVWDNSDSACFTGSFGTVAFSSALAQSTWQNLGLHTNSATSGYCQSLHFTNYPGSNTSLPSGVGPLDAGSLPTDPATLAEELSDGTTGIASLDSVSPPSGVSPGLYRAAILLTVPPINEQPTFYRTLYNALATMPGITSLGSVRTHSGSTGVGFGSGAGNTMETIVVDPSTGQLLEATNPPAMSGLWEFLLLQAYLGSLDIPGSLAAGSANPAFGLSLRWIDPSDSSSVTSQSSVPPLPQF